MLPRLAPYRSGGPPEVCVCSHAFLRGLYGAMYAANATLANTEQTDVSIRKEMRESFATLQSVWNTRFIAELGMKC